MATSETHCTDTYTLPRGDQGIRGLTGIAGIDGAQGPVGPTGLTGPTGSYKIDTNINQGNLPYAEINALSSSNTWDLLSFIIFPGTAVFTPQYLKVAYSILASTSTGTVNFRLTASDSSGVTTTIATFSASDTNTTTHIYKIATAGLNSLPTVETIFYLEAQIISVSNKKPAEARAYALELR